jgi:hypothetical protein
MRSGQDPRPVEAERPGRGAGFLFRLEPPLWPRFTAGASWPGPRCFGRMPPGGGSRPCCPRLAAGAWSGGHGRRHALTPGTGGVRGVLPTECRVATYVKTAPFAAAERARSLITGSGLTWCLTWVICWACRTRSWSIRASFSSSDPYGRWSGTAAAAPSVRSSPDRGSTCADTARSGRKSVLWRILSDIPLIGSRQHLAGCAGRDCACARPRRRAAPVSTPAS